MNSESIKDLVRERYGSAAVEATRGRRASCCGGGGCATEVPDPITSDLYSVEQTGALPESAVLASLGCGNPTALAELHEGETVLDLGSGGGIDVLLSARRVGPSGRAYGLDMTDEMLALAEQNRQRAGAQNAIFLRGEMENIPLPSGSVDVIISNCVINLSVDKERVLEEAFRVLRPGGRLAIADIVAAADVPDEIRRDAELWVGCVAGALTETEYRGALENAGFTGIGIETTRTFTAADAEDYMISAGSTSAALPSATALFMSSFVRAVKPHARS